MTNADGYDDEGRVYYTSCDDASFERGVEVKVYVCIKYYYYFSFVLVLIDRFIICYDSLVKKKKI